MTVGKILNEMLDINIKRNGEARDKWHIPWLSPLLTTKIGTVKVCWTIWADLSNMSSKPVRPVKTTLSN